MAAEVGEGQVAIVPVFKGFRKAVTQQVDGATADSSSRFQKGFGRGAQKAGTDSGKGFARAFSVQTSGVSDTVVRKLQSGVNAASKALTVARNRELDLAGKVRVAETQLAEAQAKWGDESSKTVAAQERLATAQRNLATQQTAVQVATDKLTRAQASLAKVTAPLERSTLNLGAGFRRFFQDFASGLGSVKAGQSSFTGLGGALGSLARIALGPVISGFQRLSPLLAPVVTAFGQVRTAVTGLASSAAAKVGSLLSSGMGAARSAVDALAARFPTVAAGVQLVGKTASGVFGGIRASLGPLGTIAGIAGQAILAGFSVAFSAVKSLASDAVTFVGSTMKTAAAVIGTTVAASIGSGFSRLTTIEDAEAQLKALGHSTQSVNDIIASANTSVTGTYFKLQDAITLATSATAAGIKEGQPLTGYLRLIADTATVAHSSLGDVGLIFNSIQSQGKAYTQDLNQLAQRGLPVWQALADVYHVNVDQLHTMVSNGDVDMAHFQQAMQNMVGGAAVAAGNTTSGSLKNIGAALAKFGAAIDSTVFPALQPLFQLVYNGFQAATAAVQPLASQVAPKIQAAFGPPLQAASDMISKLSDSLKGVKLPDLSGLGSVFSALAPVIGGAVAAFSGLLGQLPLIGRFLPVISGPLGVLIGLFTTMLTQSPALRSALGGLFGTLGKVASMLASAVGPVASSLVSVINELAGVLGNTLAAVLPLVSNLLLTLARIFVSLLPSLTPIVDVVAQVAEQLGGTLAGVIVALLPMITQLVQMLGPILTSVFAALVPIIGQVLPVVSQLASIFAQVFLQLMTAAMPIVTQLIGFIAQLVPVLMPIVTTVAQLLGPLAQLIGLMLNLAVQAITPLIGLFTTLLPPILGIVNVVLQAFLPVIQDMMQMLSGLITFLTGVFTGNWSQAWAGIKQIGQGFINGIIDTVKGIGTIFAQVPGMILNALKGAGGWLVGVGRDIVNGLMSGIGDLAGKIGSWFLSKIPGWIVDPFKAALGIHSPSRVFRDEVGKQIPPGIVEGVEAGMPSAARRVQEAANQLVRVPAVTASSSGAAGASVQGGNQFVITAAQDPEATAMTVARRLRFAGV